MWQGRIQVVGPINNFTRAKGGHRLGMSSWGLLRCHCQWMAQLPWIFTVTELECSDNQPRHLRYGSRWANTCLECSSLSHWKGHLSLLSGWVPQWPHCSWAASSVCLWAGISQKPVLWVLFWMNFHKAAKTPPAVKMYWILSPCCNTWRYHSSPEQQLQECF